MRCCLKGNEEELNRYFLNIYGLEDEIAADVEDEYVSIRKADLKRDIRSFVSYAIGCMFGRYSLNKQGLAYAGGNFEDVFRKKVLSDEYDNRLIFGNDRIAVTQDYDQIHIDGDFWADLSYGPDADNIIPICDDEYFEDDIVGRFVKFVEVVYGKETLEENLRFIADALGGRGSSREVVRNYFLNDFFADHCSAYAVTGSGKRPIYWLFSSGKKNGFKALIYMHRYQPDLLARMRTDYVHEQQERYRTQLQMLEEAVQTAAPSERVKLNKKITKLKDQALELQQYEEKLHHLADQMISIDLDDGVKVNYAKFQDVLEKIK